MRKSVWKKNFTFLEIVIVAAVTVLLVSVVSYAVNVPYTFSSGTTAKSSEVNSNFQTLETAVTALEQQLSPSGDINVNSVSYSTKTNYVAVLGSECLPLVGGGAAAGDSYYYRRNNGTFEQENDSHKAYFCRIRVPDETTITSVEGRVDDTVLNSEVELDFWRYDLQTGSITRLGNSGSGPDYTGGLKTLTLTPFGFTETVDLTAYAYYVMAHFDAPGPRLISIVVTYKHTTPR